MRRERRREAPTATYRIQLGPDRDFAELAADVDHLHRLGVSHAYLSPVLQAAPGSQHGYDVIDHDRINDELGGEPGLRSAARALAKAGLGILLDVVPNHMALTTPESHNKVLWGALRDGAGSPYARWLDVDWDQERPLLMPVLGRRIDECLDAGEITVEPAGPAGELVVRYYDHVLPVAAGTEQLPLEELLAAQHYRLAYWRIADEELNYRRFFDVDTLMAVRMEDPEVFAATHRLVLALVEQNVVHGLRIDHPDGLADPGGYLRHLHEATAGCYVVVEKILVGDELLPQDWACDGTTGYDAMYRITNVFVDPAGEAVLRAGFREVAGVTDDWPAVAEQSRRDVLGGPLVAEVDRLAGLAFEICQHELRLRDHTRRGLTEAVVELLTAVPVYRVYVTPGTPAPAAAAAVLEHAATVAVAARPDRASEIALLVDLALARRGSDRRKDEFCRRFQQTTGPAVAKGVEDTATYRWFPLCCLNDVGSEPDVFGLTAPQLHRWAARRHRDWPLALTATSTHDAKRSEDVRARIAVLSEIPGEWTTTVRAWRDIVGTIAARAPEGLIGDERLDWLAWQTVVGAWPIDETRLREYLLKAAREAKLVTSWVAPVSEAEQAIADFVTALFADQQLVGSIGQVVARLHPGFVPNVLGQRLLALVLPGVVDIYQGCEIVSLRLVDPDNRHRPDPRDLAAAVERGLAAVPDPAADLDAAKARLTTLGLRLRRDEPELLGPDAAYQGLFATGAAADHLVAVARGDRVVGLVTRWALGLAAGGGWRDTRIALPRGRWYDGLTETEYVVGGEPVEVADLLHAWPVALLVRQDGA